MAVADSHKPHLPDFVPASPFHTEEHEAFRNTLRLPIADSAMGRCPRSGRRGHDATRIQELDPSVGV
jgi:hypothetical protein